MSKNPSLRQPMGPLSVGNVVSAGLRIYRDHFKSYFGLTIKALLWTLITIYGWAKSFQIQAIISRQVFKELVNQPESITTTRITLTQRFWSFWAAQFLIGLIGFGVNLCVFLVLSNIGAIPIAILIGNSNSSPQSNLIIALVQNVVNLITLIISVWFYSHFFIAELPLALENNMNSTNSIGRSWELTKGFVFRIQLIILAAAVISFPILLLALAPIFFLIKPLFANNFSLDTLLVIISSIIFLGIFLWVVGTTLMMPFWQAIKAVIYYDIWSRREALGLQVRDSRPQ